MHVTQKEIADRLGVSRQLVTHALSGGGTISDQKRRKIVETAEEMGYRRNELARAVMTGRSRTLGILTSASLNEAAGRTLSGAAQEAAEHGYATKLMYLAAGTAEAQAQIVVQRCTTWRLDGVLVLGLSDHHLELLRREMSFTNRPIAFAGSVPPEGAIGAYSDDATGWRLAMRHLVDLGHRRISHLGGGSDSKLARNRRDLCLQVMGEFGLRVEEKTSTYSSWREADKVEQGLSDLLNVAQLPTALLCSGDATAMLAIRALHHRGIEVPKQLSVVGFGGLEVSNYCDPALTTIAQPHEDVARHAVRQLLGQIEAQGTTGKGLSPSDLSSHQAFKLTKGFELIVRQSTAPPIR